MLKSFRASQKRSLTTPRMIQLISLLLSNKFVLGLGFGPGELTYFFFTQHFRSYV